METLGDTIERHRRRVHAYEVDHGQRPENRPLSNNQLRDRANGLHSTTIQSWIDTGEVGKPEQLLDLARAFVTPDYALDTILAELQEAAGLPVGAGVVFDLPLDYLMFDPQLRATIVQWMRTMGDALLREHDKHRAKGRIVRSKATEERGPQPGRAGR